MKIRRQILDSRFQSLLVSSIWYLTSASTIYAASGSFSVNLGDEVKSRVAINTDLGTFVSKGFSAIIMAAGLATFGYLILGGVTWITAGGDKGKLEEARNKITNGIIGLAIVASAWAIYLLLDYFFGIGIAK
ncbi:MAG: hypothetical protein ABII21_03880 [bacterium]